MNLRSSLVKTKKQHKCFACCRKFQPGTKMIYWVSKFEGDFAYGYTCLTCNQIIKMDKDSECFMEGYTTEYYDGLMKTPEEVLNYLTNQ
jgi:hypothetical protein